MNLVCPDAHQSANSLGYLERPSETRCGLTLRLTLGARAQGQEVTVADATIQVFSAARQSKDHFLNHVMANGTIVRLGVRCSDVTAASAHG